MPRSITLPLLEPAVGDDADVDAGRSGAHQPLRQRLAQAGEAAGRTGLADHDVGGAALADDPRHRGDEVELLLDQERRPEHRGKLAQRGDLALLLPLDGAPGRLHPKQVEVGAEPLRRAPGAATRRWELGCGRTSASSRSPTAFGVSAATRSSSRVPTGSACRRRGAWTPRPRPPGAG